MDSNPPASTSSTRSTSQRYKKGRPLPSKKTLTIPPERVNSFPSSSQTLGSAAISSETTMPSASTSGALPGRRRPVQPSTVSASSNLHTKSISVPSVPVSGIPHHSQTTRQTERRRNAGHRISSSNPTLLHPDITDAAPESLLIPPVEQPIPRISRPIPHQIAPYLSLAPPLASTSTSSTIPWHELMSHPDANRNRNSTRIPPQPSSMATYAPQYDHRLDTPALPPHTGYNQVDVLVQRSHPHTHMRRATNRFNPVPPPPPRRVRHHNRPHQRLSPEVQMYQDPTSFVAAQMIPQLPPHIPVDYSANPTQTLQNYNWYEPTQYQIPYNLLLEQPSYTPQYTSQPPHDRALGNASLHTVIHHGQGVGIVATSSNSLSMDAWNMIPDQGSHQPWTSDDGNAESR